MLHFIYELVDDDDIPFYVGITDDPNTRYRGHLHDIGSNREKVDKIQGLCARSVQPKMRIIEIVDGSREEAEGQEKYWIHTYENRGIALTNITHIQRGKKEPRQIHPIIRMMDLQEAGLLPPIKGDDLVWLWERYLKREGKEDLPEWHDALVKRFLDTIPPDRIRDECDIELFKICIECF